METRTYSVYSFEELPKEAQQKALDKIQEDNDYPFLGECMQDQLEQLCKRNKIKGENTKVYYSLSHCQGDGAMFEGRLYWKSYVIDIEHSGRYYHNQSKTYSIESVNTGKDANEQVYKEFEDIYTSICNGLEKYGYETIDYENSEEAIKETIEANEYMFTIEGKIA